MNHVYRLKRSGRTQQLQPVPETARSAGKGQARTGKTLVQTVAATVASVALGGLTSLAHAQQAPPAATQLPQGGVVTRGSANIVTNTGSNNAQLTVNQTSNRAVIDWASFNVGSNAKVQFNQPGSNAVTLNNILGNNASQIYGQISANGQVFLSNPNGIYFSPTAQVNVGGLVATTGKANADDFMAGKTVFNREGSTGSIVNEGQLKAAAGGYIALLAPEVRNQGVVIAQAGSVALATGEAITLSFNTSGTGLAGLTTTPQAITALVENRSAVLAEGGQIILSAHALASLQGAVVKNSGQLSASSLTEKGGKIVLMADKVELTGTSKIEANAATGGGTVLVGGDWQGSGDTRQAIQVNMAQGASIEANATQNGDGGKVVLWSDVSNPNSLTQVEGRIEAKGARMGSGGQVETSGHTLKIGDGTQVDTGGGLWLLDPYDFTVAASGGDITGAALGMALAGGNVSITTSASSTPAVTGATVGGGSTGSGDIVINDTLGWSANTLTLSAYRSVLVNNVVSVSGTAGLTVTTNTGNAAYSLNAGNSTLGTREGYLKMKQGFVATNAGTSGTHEFAGKINWTSSGTLRINSENYSMITSAAGLSGIGNSASGKFALGSDITLSGSWTPLTGFAGKLEGLGHTISGLQINATTANAGLFGTITGGVAPTVLQNMGLVGANVTSSANDVGGFVGFINFTNTSYTAYLRNLFVDDTSRISGSTTARRFGGWVGESSSSTLAAAPTVIFADGYNAAKVNGSVNGLEYLGGVVGQNTGFAYMMDIFNAGQVVAGIPTSINRNALGGSVGGLVGFINNGLSLSAENLRNYADIYGGYGTGGIFGTMYSVVPAPTATTALVRQSVNYGNVNGLAQAGGILGASQVSPAPNKTVAITLEFVKNMGAVNTVNETSGGIVGYAVMGTGASLTINSAVNKGAVSGNFYVGGLLGYSYSSVAPVSGSHPESVVKIYNAHNSGTVTGISAYDYGVGGIFGYNRQSYMDLSSVYNTGQVTSAAGNTAMGGVGGIFNPRNPNTGPDDNGKFVNVYSANDKVGGGNIFGSACTGSLSCVTVNNITVWSGINNTNTAVDIAAASLATLGFNSSFWGGGLGEAPYLLATEKILLNYTLSTISSGYAYSGNAVPLSGLWSASSIFGPAYGGLAAGTDFSFSYSGSAVTGFTNAGTYAGITVNVLGSNYVLAPTGNTSGNLTILPAVLTPVLQGTVSKEYDSNRDATLASANFRLTGWVGSDGATVTKTAGTYDNANAASGKTVTVSVTNADYTATGSTNLSNYTLPSSFSGAVGVITAKPVTVTNTARSTTYDGTSSYGALASGAAFTTSSLVGSDSVASVTQTASGTGVTSGGVAQTGSFTVTPSSAVMGTGTASNYSFSYVDSIHTVNPAPVLVVPVTGSLQGSVSKVYDGNNIATLTSANYALTGWVGSDGASVTKTTGTYDNANAGSGKTVTVSVTNADYVATGFTNLSNYTLPSSISGAVGVITAKPVTVTNTSRSITYDGMSTYGALASGTAFTTSALVGSDSVASVTQTASGTGVTGSGIAQAGSVTVTPSRAVLGSGMASNYSFSYAPSTLTVNPVVLSASLVGSGVQGTVSKVYDGNNTATLTSANYALTGFVGSEGATVTQSRGIYDSVNAGSGKSLTVTLGASDYTATGSTHLTNYSLPTAVAGAVGVIMPKPVTVTNTTGETAFDRTTTYGALATGTVFSTSALVGSDSVASVTQTASGTDVTAAGVAQPGSFTVSPSNAVLARGTASNYSFSYVPSTHTVKLTDGMKEDLTASKPLVLSPPLAFNAAPKQMTLFKLPKGGQLGVLQIAVNDSFGDVQIELPDELQQWIKSVGAVHWIERDADTGISLNDVGTALNVSSRAVRRLPLNVILRTDKGNMIVRFVKG